ncbi:MAG: 50S ribosomal protein L23 [Buchnera aphidicola (Ceratovacuna japonica)]
MKFKEKVFKIFKGIHVSEKSSIISKKKNNFIIKVLKDSNKHEIKKMLEEIFRVTVLKINTLIVKGKKKNNRKGISGKEGYRKNWKKVYITLKKGDNFNF